MKLFSIITFAALALTAEAKFRDRVGKNDARQERKLGKAGKADSIGHECQSCENQLPGYALFGKHYEDDDFYENLVEHFTFGDDNTNFHGDEPEYGEDYFVPGPIGESTGFKTCYDDQGSLFICALITFLGEAIYRSELLSCLYTQIVTVAREFVSDEWETCQWDLEGGLDRKRKRKRRLLTDHQKDAVGRVLESGVTDPLQKDTLGAMAMVGAESLLDLMEVLGVDCESTDNPFIEMICNGGENRKLLPSVDPLPIGSVIVEFLEEVDGVDADTAMAIQDNLFFLKCNFPEFDSAGECAAIFGLLKTFDAIICRFRDERGCGSETCDKDLTFDINFQAERLKIDLPFDPYYPIAHLLAPCDYCLANKSGGCSAFCPYYHSVSECPPVHIDYLAYDLGFAVQIGNDWL